MEGIIREYEIENIALPAFPLMLYFTPIIKLKMKSL